MDLDTLEVESDQEDNSDKEAKSDKEGEPVTPKTSAPLRHGKRN